MAKSKLGIYLISTGDLPVDWFAKAQPVIAVSMDANPDYWRKVKQVSPGTFIMGRHYFDSQPLNDPATNAKLAFSAMSQEIARMTGIYDAWMGYNEMAITNVQQAKDYALFQTTLSALIHSLGSKSVAYSWSEGNPDPSLWPTLVSGLVGSDFLGVHEYDAPSMSRTQPYRCLRYRSAPQLLPIIIGECGIDGGVQGIDQPQTGWKHFCSVDAYVSTLKWYDSELQKDANVIGGAIFAAHWNMGNGTFDIADQNTIRDYIAGGTPSPVPTLEQTAISAVVAKQNSILNPATALAKSATANHFGLPCSPEVTFTWNNDNYIAQAYANPGGIERVGYVKTGDWANVKWTL